jgi:hypothetical protein
VKEVRQDDIRYRQFYKYDSVVLKIGRLRKRGEGVHGNIVKMVSLQNLCFS